MSLLFWDPGYASGVPQLDRMRHDMLTVINFLNDCLAEDQEAEALNVAFAVLSRYLEEDMAEEERLMAQSHFHGLAEHTREHKQFAGEIVRLRDAYRAGDRHAVSSRLLMVLASWWVNHAVGSDLRLGDWFGRPQNLRLVA